VSLSVASFKVVSWQQSDERESMVWCVRGVRKLERYERSSMGCQILKALISRSMPLADAALTAMGAIPTLVAEHVTGRVFASH
jgi:hypothetical protein